MDAGSSSTPRPLAELRAIHEMPLPPSTDDAESKMFAEFLRNHFPEHAQLLVHALKAAGRAAEAEAVVQEAIRHDPSDEMKRAVETAPDEGES